MRRPPCGNVLTLELPEGTVSIRLTRRQRRSIGLSVRNGEVELVAPPSVPLARLVELVERKRDWIARHWRHERQLAAARAAVPDALLLEGSRLPVVLRDGAGRAQLVDGVLLVGGGAAGCRAQLAAWLRDAARQRFPSRVAALARLAVRPPTALALSNARRRWGSCTAAGVVRLNWRLVQAPVTVLDYVAAHELAHLRHMNHSAAFWRETERLYPEWRAARAWLRHNGEQLFAFG